MVSRTAPMCMWCKHYNRSSEGKPTCTAFPNGIPDEIIFTQESLHVEPYKGDHGIQFELMSDEEQKRVFGKVVPMASHHLEALGLGVDEDENDE